MFVYDVRILYEYTYSIQVKNVHSLINIHKSVLQSVWLNIALSCLWPELELLTIRL